MPAALKAYWAKHRKPKRSAKRKRRHHARPRVQQQPLYIIVD
jgi:hypothetical protein